MRERFIQIVLRYFAPFSTKICNLPDINMELPDIDLGSI